MDMLADMDHAAGWRSGLRQAWRLSRPFWLDPAERGAWWELGLTILLTLATVGLTVRFSIWQNAFYDTLQQRDLKGFWHQLAIFCGLALVFIVTAVYRLAVQQTQRTPDNPDQRVAAPGRRSGSGAR